MSNLSEFYTKTMTLLNELSAIDNFRCQNRLPKLSDKGVIALSLAAESSGIDSERHLFKQLPGELMGQIERSVYNRRRRGLFEVIESFRQAVAERLTTDQPALYLVDSMPVETCKVVRAPRIRICQESPDTAPDHGYCAAQKQWYHGYKLHAVCNSDGVVQALDLSKASTHDIHYLNDVREQFSNCVLIGDKGYLSAQWQEDLFADRRIDLKTPPRKNQPDLPALPAEYRKARKRIETVFSQLSDQFMIRRNYAKSFAGLASRVLCKVAAFTFIQWLNVRENRPISHVKIAFS